MEKSQIFSKLSFLQLLVKYNKISLEYNLFDTLPEKYESVLPSVEDIERRIGLKIENVEE